MRKFFLCAVVLVSVSVPAVAQQCTLSANGVALFQKYVRQICGLTPTAAEAVWYHCNHPGVLYMDAFAYCRDQGR